jgi:CDP-glucose 4,6-dehydratase
MAGYLTFAYCLWQQAPLAGAYNFGPPTGEAVTVRELAELAQAAYGSGEVHYSAADEGPHESAWLALEIAKARAALGVAPKLTLAQAVNKTMAWYRAQHGGANALALCRSDIAAYEALA